MSEWLLIIWIALLGTDRIDLFGGTGWFVLTPFLLLTPLVLWMEFLRLGSRGGRFHIPARAIRYVFVATCFLSVLLLSVLFSTDLASSAKRFALVLFEVYATFLVALSLAARSHPDRVLVAGAYFGLAVGFVFDVAQVMSWLIDWPPQGAVVNLVPDVYAELIPRLSTYSVDANRGGLVLLIYLYILFQFGQRSRVRSAFGVLGAVAILATLSRSAVLAAGVTCLVVAFRGRIPKITHARILLANAAGAVLVLALFAQPGAIAAGLKLSEPLAGRVSSKEGSSREHFRVSGRGIAVATEGVPNALIGIGFGNSFKVLQDIYPGNKYGNFHSFYISLLAESGILALFLGLLLVLYPAVRAGPYQALIVGFVLFNVFYQATVEPAFWFILAAAWIGLAAKRTHFPRLRVPDSRMAAVGSPAGSPYIS